jgi:general secretion pathway protein H
MPTSVPGNPESGHTLAADSHRPSACSGFTLLELLLVVSLMALATAGVSFSLRDSAQRDLDLQAQQVAAQLNAAHAQARSTGVPVHWQAMDGGWVLGGHRMNWRQADTRLTPPTGTLGPEPLLPPTQLTLRQGQQTRLVGTGGVRPFQLLDTPVLP